MDRPLTILHIEDNPNDAEMVRATLEAEGLAVAVTRVETREAALAALERDGWDLILCDFSLPAFDGPSALALARARRPEVPFLFVSGTIGEERAIESLTSGATDYVLKTGLACLVPAVRRALREAEERCQREAAEARIHQLAYFDALTGLPNRTRLLEALARATSVWRPDQPPVALLLTGLRHFTEINYTLGHQTANRLLREVADRLTRSLPKDVLLAYMGGDDFAALAQADAADAAALADAMLGALHEPIVLDGFTLEVGASIGAAFCPEHSRDFVPLLERADRAKHRVKTSGGGFAVYSPELDPTSPDRLALMGELRQAILAGEMVLHYQPKVSLTTGQVVAAEALVRWEHPARGLLAPGRFIGLAEQTGLIKPLTYWVVSEALREAAAWRRAGFDVPVAVNLSTKNLLDPALAERIAKLLDGADRAAGALALELTESTIMADPAQARQQLARLNRMGIRLAVDDFGTGYSSLAYLKQLPVQELKIDKVFVQGLMKDRHDAALVRASLDLGHILGLTAVAEGAEDRQTWLGLVAVGCDAVQGYVVSHPLPSADFLAWLKARGGAAEPAGFE